MLTPEAIRLAREATDESQAAFAARFGVHQATIHRWETRGPPTRGPGAMAIEQIIAGIEKQESAPS